ncbi:MAG: hypothetical protein NZ805_04395 [Armatimonadetes bacterium]|nr:hypothetical protein [Armatimonadota bacterium]MDW8027959.1 hypothetical protein [Armatimonadota bacterium]
MPSESTHLAQVRHNLVFLRSFYAPTTPYPDWAVTVAFYTALHAIEAALASQHMHSQSHVERRRYVRQMFPHLWRLYYRLDVFSRRTRYEGFQPDPVLLQQLVDHDLNTILRGLGTSP